MAMKERDKARRAFAEIAQRYPDLADQARHELAIIDTGDKTASR
jgi:TolA-binding protein